MWWFFKKKKEEDDGSVRAYEYRGTLYKTKKEMERKVERDFFSRKVNILGSLLCGEGPFTRGVRIQIEYDRIYSGQPGSREFYTARNDFAEWFVRYHEEIQRVCDVAKRIAEEESRK